MAFERRIAAVGDAFGIGRLDRCRRSVPDQLVVRMAAVARRALRRIGVVREHALALAPSSSTTSCGALVKRFRNGVVDRSLRDQLVQQRHEERAVGARA